MYSTHEIQGSSWALRTSCYTKKMYRGLTDHHFLYKMPMEEHSDYGLIWVAYTHQYSSQMESPIVIKAS